MLNAITAKKNKSFTNILISSWDFGILWSWTQEIDQNEFAF